MAHVQRPESESSRSDPQFISEGMVPALLCPERRWTVPKFARDYLPRQFGRSAHVDTSRLTSRNVKAETRPDGKWYPGDQYCRGTDIRDVPAFLVVEQKDRVFTERR